MCFRRFLRILNFVRGFVDPCNLLMPLFWSQSQGILKGDVSLYHWIQTSQTRDKQYSYTTTFSIPCPSWPRNIFFIPDSSDLKDHEWENHRNLSNYLDENSKNFHCDFCTAGFKVKLGLATHVNRFHKEEVSLDSWPLAVAQCDYIGSSISSCVYRCFVDSTTNGATALSIMA